MSLFDMASNEKINRRGNRMEPVQDPTTWRNRICQTVFLAIAFPPFKVFVVEPFLSPLCTFFGGIIVKLFSTWHFYAEEPSSWKCDLLPAFVFNVGLYWLFERGAPSILCKYEARTFIPRMIAAGLIGMWWNTSDNQDEPNYPSQALKSSIGALCLFLFYMRFLYFFHVQLLSQQSTGTVCEYFSWMLRGKPLRNSGGDANLLGERSPFPGAYFWSELRQSMGNSIGHSFSDIRHSVTRSWSTTGMMRFTGSFWHRAEDDLGDGVAQHTGTSIRLRFCE